MSLLDAFASLTAMPTPRRRVTIDAAPLTATPGTTVAGRIVYAALDRPRLLRAMRVHLTMTSTVLQVGTSHDGKLAMAPVSTTRDLIEPIVLCTDLPVPEGREWWTRYEVRVPVGNLSASMPGQLEYHVVARAAVDGESVGAWAHVPLVVVPGGAPADAAQVPGASCLAPTPGGTLAPAMIVELRGAVTLVARGLAVDLDRARLDVDDPVLGHAHLRTERALGPTIVGLRRPGPRRAAARLTTADGGGGSRQVAR